VGQVDHTLPRGEPVRGVTSLGDEVYVLRDKERDQVEVYDVITCRLQRCLTVPNTRVFTHMTSCEHYRYVYVASYTETCCVHGLNVDVPGAGTWWCVKDKPAGLSVNAAHNVLVTFFEVRKIKEFNSRGVVLRELTLPDDIINPFHAIQLTTGQFIVCHGGPDDAVHRVCKMSAGGDVIQSHGGQRGSNIGQYNRPVHLAVDDNEFVFVVDLSNRRVKLLSPSLDHIRQVVSPDDLQWLPNRLYLDVRRRRLYVVENECRSGVYTAGRVMVFNV